MMRWLSVVVALFARRRRGTQVEKRFRAVPGVAWQPSDVTALGDVMDKKHSDAPPRLSALGTSGR